MIKIINGIRYDINKAELIDSWNDGYYYCNDFHYYCEALYKTKNERWFLFISGGALSSMAISVPGGSGGSSKIIPCSEDEVYEWLERKGCTKTIEKYFSDKLIEA